MPDAAPCRGCGKPLAPRDAAAYGNRCEDCWSESLPAGASSCLGTESRQAAAARLGFDAREALGVPGRKRWVRP